MKTRRGVLLIASAALLLGAVLTANWHRLGTAFWQAQVSPGPLSPAHASLESTCISCHTPGGSIEATKCVGCHVNNTALLQRAPTAFHASVGSCSTCHREHEVTGARPRRMDHDALARIGLETISRRPDDPSSSRLLAWLRQHDRPAETLPTHPLVTTPEAALDCRSCHATADRHQGYFGGDCASCHRTASWEIAEYQHPSPRSVSCVQCHQPPPSHRMMHFNMVSQTVAKRSDARVDQCFACHQTTSWNDIRSVGWYKHH